VCVHIGVSRVERSTSWQSDVSVCVCVCVCVAETEGERDNVYYVL